MTTDTVSHQGLDSAFARCSKTGQDPHERFQQHFANIRAHVHQFGGHNIRRVQVEASGSLPMANVAYPEPNQPQETTTEFNRREMKDIRARFVEKEKLVLVRWGSSGARGDS